MSDTQRVIPAPGINPETVPFWKAASEQQLLVKKCNDCGEFHFYPRSICPFCFSDKTDWSTSSGRGTIYSFSVMRRGVPVPYAIAYVELNEGPKIVTNIVNADFDKIEVGQPVRVVFQPSDSGQLVPMFELDL
ncbi:Zn-ribbon domain-containing OB-fold protein [Burkholderia multivorans]|uniref:Zn-ribbon domain-containing OB-fold protein n=1 Tax=Burkholderia multivorans TaxID=87883 RepID=UPI001C24F81F|nr:Zn-ribbon domain-containing OB-fold protein [Burkholderia multivorans]MBU9477683.1 Zn-ribbon domain-containing OB-fold protein [Burkholderia multivorans]